MLKPDVQDLQGETKQLAIETIDAISQNISYISKIVSDLQDYARPLKPEPTQVNDLCCTIEEVLSTLDVPSNVKAELNCAKTLPALSLDLTFLKRILVNLGTNAIQAMPNGANYALEHFKKGIR
jgi:C4-dicarboxylate-specific signal transduction histidine kinase